MPKDLRWWSPRWKFLFQWRGGTPGGLLQLNEQLRDARGRRGGQPVNVRRPTPKGESQGITDPAHKRSFVDSGLDLLNRLSITHSVGFSDAWLWFSITGLNGSCKSANQPKGTCWIAVKKIHKIHMKEWSTYVVLFAQFGLAELTMHIGIHGGSHIDKTSLRAGWSPCKAKSRLACVVAI